MSARLVLSLLVVHLCAGCAVQEAKPRYLTEEQDAHLREVCEQPGGCALIPGRQWHLIEELLEQLGISVEQKGV